MKSLEGGLNAGTRGGSEPISSQPPSQLVTTLMPPSAIRAFVRTMGLQLALRGEGVLGRALLRNR